jgi:hypothetical protein
LEPILTKLRIEIAEPKFAKFKSEALDPRRTAEKHDIELPNRTALLTEVLEPIVMNSRILNADPNRE